MSRPGSAWFSASAEMSPASAATSGFAQGRAHQLPGLGDAEVRQLGERSARLHEQLGGEEVADPSVALVRLAAEEGLGGAGVVEALTEAGAQHGAVLTAPRQ